MNLAAEARTFRAVVSRNLSANPSRKFWFVSTALYPLPLLALNIYQYIGISGKATASTILAAKYGVVSIEGMIILGTVAYTIYGRLLTGSSLSLTKEGWGGTLEPILLTPASRLTILLANGASTLVDTTWLVAVVFLAGWLLFGFNLGSSNLPVVCVATLSAVLAILAFATFLSGFFLAGRNANQYIGLLQGPVRFFSGTTYPTSALPSILQVVAYLIPVTYCVQTLRDSVYAGNDVFGLLREFMVLYVVTAVLFALSYLTIRALENHAKRTGELSYF